MSETGRYYIRDEKTGRTFCIEPQHDRTQKATDVAFRNGHGGEKGLTEGVKGKPSQGGSLPDDGSESIITEENGYKDIVVIGPYMSPQAYIGHILEKGKRLNDEEEIKNGYARLPD